MAKAGAPPKFKEAHVNWVFWKIANNQPMGRKMLVQETGLGEGSLRTILIKLDEYGLVKSARPGRTLTENGTKVFRKLCQIVRVEGLGSLGMTKKDHNCIVLVRNGGKRVGSGMKQRDEAVKVGKGGATTLVIKKRKLVMPGFGKSLEIDKEYPRDAERVKKLVNPEEGDAIVIGSEDYPQAAEEAAWVAASTLLP